jgi:DNA polymerase-3 subunit delta
LEQSANFDLAKLVFFEEKAVDKRSKLYKYIKKQGEVIESAHLDVRELGEWLQKQLQFRNLKASSQVQTLLLDRVGDNQHILLSELDKLELLLRAEGRSQVEVDDCELVSYVDREHQVWALLDAISARNRPMLMSEFQKLYHGEEDFQYLLTMLAKQLKILYLLKDPSISRDEIVSEFKIHPFTLTKAGKYLHKFELGTLKMLFRKLFDLDLAVKEGKIEPGLGLNLFLLSI